jgi:hypothetical protein
VRKLVGMGIEIDLQRRRDDRERLAVLQSRVESLRRVLEALPPDSHQSRQRASELAEALAQLEAFGVPSGREESRSEARA